MDILAVDPGLRVCGVATFEDGFLKTAAEVKTLTKDAEAGPLAWGGMADAICAAVGEDRRFGAVVVELPQVYRGPLLKGDPNDLLHLVGVLGHLCGQLEAHCGVGEVEFHHYRPAEWKGQVPKAIHHERIQRRLSKSEITVWPKGHNAKDAVGLGLFHLGRMERARK